MSETPQKPKRILPPAPPPPTVPRRPLAPVPGDPPPGESVAQGEKKPADPTRYGDWEKNGRCIDF